MRPDDLMGLIVSACLFVVAGALVYIAWAGLA